MQILIAISNSLLYILVLFFYWRKYKTTDVYFTIFAVYTFTAIMCACFIISEPNYFKNVTFFNYVYLLTCVLIFLSPLRGMKLGDIYQIKETPQLKILSWIFIISGVISIYYTLPQTIELINSGEWGVVRDLLYEDTDNIQLYSSQFERIAKNVNSYLSPFGIVFCFFQLTKQHKNKVLILLLFSVWFIQSFLGATLVASRGMIVQFLIKVLLVFVLFKDYIGHAVKRIAVIIMSLLSIPLAIYLFAVSVSRFGEDNAGSSLFYYLGHSISTFNQNVMGTMHDYAHGVYAFSFFVDLLGGNADINGQSLGLTCGTAFYTLVGDFYIDWGPFFTILMFFLLARVLGVFTHKRRKRLSDIIVILYFSGVFVNGVFCLGTGYILGWVMLFVVYFIVRSAERGAGK